MSYKFNKKKQSKAHNIPHTHKPSCCNKETIHHPKETPARNHQPKEGIKLDIQKKGGKKKILQLYYKRLFKLIERDQTEMEFSNYTSIKNYMPSVCLQPS